MSERVKIRPGTAMYANETAAEKVATTRAHSELEWAGQIGDRVAVRIPNGELRWISAADLAPPKPGAHPLMQTLLAPAIRKGDSQLRQAVFGDQAEPPALNTLGLNAIQLIQAQIAHARDPEAAAAQTDRWRAENAQRAAQQQTKEQARPNPLGELFGNLAKGKI